MHFKCLSQLQILMDPLENQKTFEVKFRKSFNFAFWYSRVNSPVYTNFVYSNFFRENSIYYLCFEGAEATSMKILERMKKSFRMKDILDLSVSWNFQIIWTCISSIIYKTEKLFSSPVFSNKFMLPFWNLQKSTIFFGTTTGSLKISLAWFL